MNNPAVIAKLVIIVASLNPHIETITDLVATSNEPVSRIRGNMQKRARNLAVEELLIEVIGVCG